MKRESRKIQTIFKPLLDFYRSSEFRNFIIQRSQARLGCTKLWATPIVLQIEFTNRCNLKCATCGHSHWDKDANKGRFLDLDLLPKVESFYQRASEILIGGYGEPSLHPQFDQLIDHFRRVPHKKLVMISNGLLLQKKWESLRKLNQLILSLDGVEDVYEKHRGVSFQKLRENLDFYRENRGEQRFEWNVVWNRSTHQNLREVVDLANEYEVDQINLLPEKMYSSVREQECLFLPEELHSLHLEIQRLRTKFRGNLNSPSFLRDEIPCNQPLETMFILSNGEVMACCSAIFHGNPYRFSLGNLSTQSLDELWNHPKMVQFRLARLKGDREQYPEPCQDCAFRSVRHDRLKRPLLKS